MTAYNKTDTMDLYLYSVMPLVDCKDAAVYDAVVPMDVPEKTWTRIWRNLMKRIRYTERHEIYSPVLESCKRAAVAVLMVMSLGFASIMSIDAVRNALWETITTWYEERILFQYVTDHDILVPDTILEYKEPVLDAQYSKNEIVWNEYVHSINYNNGSNSVSYQQGLLDYYIMWLSNHDTNLHEVMIHNQQGYVTDSYIDNVLFHSIIWHDGTYAYMVIGNMDIPLLLKIAETIQ